MDHSISRFSPEFRYLQAGLQFIDNILSRAIHCILGLISVPGYLTHLTLSDIELLLRSRKGSSLAGRLGIGWASGKNRVQEAVRMALSSPTLEQPVKMASGVLIYVVCRNEIDLTETSLVIEKVVMVFRPDARILYNGTSDPNLKEEFSITVICLYEPHELSMAV